MAKVHDREDGVPTSVAAVGGRVQTEVQQRVVCWCDVFREEKGHDGGGGGGNNVVRNGKSSCGSGGEEEEEGAMEGAAAAGGFELKLRFGGRWTWLRCGGTF